MKYPMNDCGRLSLRWLRPHLRRSAQLRSIYRLWRESLGAVRDSPAAARAWTEEWYRHEVDPWHYGSTADEQERYSVALEVVDRWAGERRLSALEVGCGEGLFTVDLAQRCRSVLGLDFSTVAIARARDRCAHLAHVRFEEWDARLDPLEGQYELVVCMDLVGELLRPLVRRRAMTQIACAVSPGGLLVFTERQKHPILEGASWAPPLARGIRWMVGYFAGDKRLRQVALRSTEHHVVAAFAAKP